MTLQDRMQEGERALAHIWKATAARGAVAIAFAVVILVWPNIGLATLIALFGTFALVSGVSTIVGAVRLPAEGGRRAWLVVEGLLGIATAVVVLVWPSLSALALLYLIAAWAIGVGIVNVVLAFTLPISGGRAVLVLLAGMLSAAFGVIMLAHPGAGAVALLSLIAGFALVTGVMQIALAAELRRVAGQVEHRVPAHGARRVLAHG